MNIYTDSLSVLISPGVFQHFDLQTFTNNLNNAEKTRALIAATRQNEVNFLKQHLNSPEWYQVTDIDGHDLLQTSILSNSRSTFDYILSLKDFPLEHVNKDGETTIEVAGIESHGDYYATALCKKGASLDAFSQTDVILKHFGTLLHFAASRGFTTFAQHLLEMDCDVNILCPGGLSPLAHALNADTSHSLTELVTSLLTYRADPTFEYDPNYNNFELCVLKHSPDVQQAMFYYMFDEYSCVRLHFEILTALARKKSAIFFEVVEFTQRLVFSEMSHVCYETLFLMETGYLKALLSKFQNQIKEHLNMHPQRFSFPQNTLGLRRMCLKVSIENIDCLLESELRCATYDFIQNLSNSCCRMSCCRDYRSLNILDLESITAHICYLLSHGYQLNEMHLQRLYEKFGYGDLIKILLYMDVEKSGSGSLIDDVMLLFLYDVTVDLETYLRDPPTLTNVGVLVDYFSHSKVRELCYSFCDGDEDIIAKVERQQQVPLLQELARNVFRRFFIQVYSIQNAKEFYTLLNKCVNNAVHRKIITYETKLY